MTLYKGTVFLNDFCCTWLNISPLHFSSCLPTFLSGWAWAHLTLPPYTTLSLFSSHSASLQSQIYPHCHILSFHTRSCLCPSHLGSPNKMLHRHVLSLLLTPDTADLCPILSLLSCLASIKILLLGFVTSLELGRTIKQERSKSHVTFLIMLAI